MSHCCRTVAFGELPAGRRVGSCCNEKLTFCLFGSRFTCGISLLHALPSIHFQLYKQAKVSQGIEGGLMFMVF